MIWQPVSQNDIYRIGSQLSERDWSILRFMRQHRYATTVHLRRRFFTGHATPSAATRACTRVLNRLYVRRILSRLERRIGGVRRGSASYVWCLDIVGDRLTRENRKNRILPHEPSFPFLDHTLAITETHVGLHEAANEELFQLDEVWVETEAWREFMTPSGARSVLKPDLKVTISNEAFNDHWYIEIDRGTESLPTLIRKCHVYEQYRRTGRAQAEHGVFPRVLWVLSDTGRVERLKAAIDKVPELPNAMFTCITNDSHIATLTEPP